MISAYFLLPFHSKVATYLPQFFSALVLCASKMEICNHFSSPLTK